MATTSVIVFLAVLLIQQPRIARSDFLSPLLSPVFDNVCKEVECGKGSCKPSSNSTFMFECKCDPGWTQTRSKLDDELKFLPCVVPNCTLNYSCTKGHTPVQEKARKANESIFDPCHWADCGGGSCNKTSAFTYKCECAEGYYNLLNFTASPCYEECAIGMDCMNLGIPVSNKSTSPPSSLSDNSQNQASPILQGNYLCLIILLMIMDVVHWQ